MGGTSYTDPELAPNTPYDYTVIALRNDFESEISEQINVTTKRRE
ncbi:fibronectin type III domain-containing protein [Paenibacillus sp. CECT 9249]|nr:fibronectin type III domain-containing protein [Paenibacillus sp. CECT 9249]